MNWETYGLLGMGAALAALTLTRSTLTQKLRAKWIGHGLLGEMLNCPYCMAHWTGIIFSLDKHLSKANFDAYIVDACIVTGMAVIFVGIILKLWLYQEAELDKYRQLISEMTSKLKEVSNHKKV